MRPRVYASHEFRSIFIAKSLPYEPSNMEPSCSMDAHQQTVTPLIFPPV